MECLLNKLSEKDELLRQYCCQIDELKKDIKNKCRKYQEVLKQLKTVRNEGRSVCESSNQEDTCENEDIEELIRIIVRNAKDEKKTVSHRLQNTEAELKALEVEKRKYLEERNEIKKQLQDLLVENERLLKEVISQKKINSEKEELLKAIDNLKSEKKELSEKVNSLHENIQELNNNFQETRWALTSEVAEKHDQVQELKRCVGVLEDKLRQADMQTHFKDNIIKELRKELKVSRKSQSSFENPTKLSSNESSTPPVTSLKTLISPKKNKDDELKVDIHIFPVNETKSTKDSLGKSLNHQSVEIQTDLFSSNMRNVSTQHKTRVQILPRSFGTLTVTPWSGAAGETAYPNNGHLGLQEAKKNLKGIYSVPFSQI